MRILLVEDELKMARAIRRGLEQEGYAVDVVADGDEALRRALVQGLRRDRPGRDAARARRVRRLPRAADARAGGRRS